MDVIDNKVDAFKKTTSGDGTAWHDTPVTVLDEVELKNVLDLSWGQSTSNILLVAEHHERGTGELLLEEQSLQLDLAVMEAKAITGIDHPDEAVRMLEVVAPIRPDRGLAAHIPKVQLEVVVLDGLDLEAEGRCDFRGVLAQELLQNSSLTSVV